MEPAKHLTLALALALTLTLTLALTLIGVEDPMHGTRKKSNVRGIDD